MGYPPNEPPWTPNRGMAFWPPVRRSIVSLWVMASSPLFYSGDVRSDSKDAQGNPYWTQELSELLTNKKVLAAHQDLRGGGQVSATNSTVVWAADCAATVQGSATAAICRYVAVFNVWCGEPRKADPPCPVAPWGNGTLATTLQLPDLGVGSISRLQVEDLWNSSGSFTLPAGKKSVTAHTEHLGATLWKVTSSPAIRIKTDTTEVRLKTDEPRNLMMRPAAAASAATAERPCSVTAGGFGDNAQVVIMPQNSTTPPASAIYTGPGARHIFSVSGPDVDSIATLVANSTAASLQQQLPGDHDEVYVTLGLDLQPPLGRHTYIDGVTITFELSGADTSLAQFGLRRVAVDETCCGSTGGVNGMMQDFCDGVYTARVPPSESAASGAQQTTVDRSHIAYVARNASRGAAFIHSSMSPDGQMVLEIVLNLKAASTGVTMRAVGVTTLRILKVTYQYPPLAVEDACALVVPWSEHGHGSIGGLWLMFYPGNNMTLIGNGYLQERWEDECCFDPPAEPRCEPTYELNQSISSLQYLGSGGGWIEGNYPPIGHTNKFFRLEGAGDAAQGRVTITQRQCGAQYNLAYTPIPFEALEPNVSIHLSIHGHGFTRLVVSDTLRVSTVCCCHRGAGGQTPRWHLGT